MTRSEQLTLGILIAIFAVGAMVRAWRDDHAAVEVGSSRGADQAIPLQSDVAATE